MNTLSYKGYSARIDFDDRDEVFVGRIVGIGDAVGFRADTVGKLKKAFAQAVEDYVAACARSGRKPRRSYSGRVMFRVKPETHRKAALAAELAGKSLNQWAEEVLEAAADRMAEAGHPR